MPHYFFNLLFGDRLSRDEEGVELRDRGAAREEAFAIIRELSDPALGGNPRRWRGWLLEAADEGGAFLRAPIGHPTLEVVTKDWRPVSERPPAPQAQRMPRPPSGARLSALARQVLARKEKTAALMERNQRLREEILRTARATAETRAQARLALAHAQRVRWAIDTGYRTAEKSSQAGGELSAWERHLMRARALWNS